MFKVKVMVRAANSTRFRESIRVASTYESQLPSLNPIVIAMVAIKFDSHKVEQNCTLMVMVEEGVWVKFCTFKSAQVKGLHKMQCVRK